MTVVGLRTAWELRGWSCLDLELVRPDRKTLVRSRSFGERVESKSNLREALATRAQRAAEKLREESLVAKGIKVFITTKRLGEPPASRKPLRPGKEEGRGSDGSSLLGIPPGGTNFQLLTRRCLRVGRLSVNRSRIINRSRADCLHGGSRSTARQRFSTP
nr:hypothetical protein [Salinibacter ruber]